tara:strand:+ start:39 stop:1250 length:1212 start_codon:yes stop_codon:yes gene_type:complete
MSALSDEYIKNFSKERKSIFNKRFRDDYDPNMSERSNILRILEEMRELGLADGGRIGLKEGLGSFETNNPNEAMKEVIKRFLEKNLETTTVPITENIFLNLGPGVSEVELGGIMKILGGELGFGASKDKGIGFNFKKEFNKGGRVAYQDGTPDRKLYETPVTDAIKSVNEKTQDLIMQGVDAFDKYSGIDQITSANFPGAFDEASGQPSDFRHQAASNLLAEALGKGQYTDPILGPISYLSGAVGASGLGAIKEIGDLAVALYDNPKNYKEAFSEFVKDNVSNIKGAFAKDKTSEELYDELMAGYVPIDPFGMDRTSLLRSQQIFAQRKKAIEDARKKQKDIIVPPQKPKRTTTTKLETGGGGGRQVDTSRGAVRGAQQDISNYQDFGEVPLAKGGLARMLGE